MKIYNYADTTREYLWESTAGISPLDNEPLIPRNATTIIPPAAQPKKARVFSGVAWTLVDDFRGEIRYVKGTRNPFVIDFLGPISQDLYQDEMQPYTTHEKWDQIRSQRNSLLYGSDWTQLSDSPVNLSTWAIYRQELRDIPQTFSTPESVIWPSKP
jgi:hypothetical protein